jgi:hypothetical protein
MGVLALRFATIGVTTFLLLPTTWVKNPDLIIR